MITLFSDYITLTNSLLIKMLDVSVTKLSPLLMTNN